MENHMRKPLSRPLLTYFSHQTLYTSPHPPPPLFTSLGKEDTVERIKSNQCASGMLHKPYARVAAMISPIIS